MSARNLSKTGLGSPGGAASPVSSMAALGVKRAPSYDMDAKDNTLGARVQRALSSKQDNSVLLSNLFQDLVDVTAPLAPKSASFDSADDKITKQLFDTPLIASINFGDPNLNIPTIVEQCVKWLLEEGSFRRRPPISAAFTFFDIFTAPRRFSRLNSL
jgi:hypothetical protein